MRYAEDGRYARRSSSLARSTGPAPPATGRRRARNLLGVRAVIAESYERIHRSNLVGMGVLPLQFMEGEGRESLGLSGDEHFSIEGISAGLSPRCTLKVTAKGADGSSKSFEVLLRVDSPQELEYVKHGGILPYVLRQLAA